MPMGIPATAAEDKKNVRNPVEMLRRATPVITEAETIPQAIKRRRQARRNAAMIAAIRSAATIAANMIKTMTSNPGAKPSARGIIAKGKDPMVGDYRTRRIGLQLGGFAWRGMGSAETAVSRQRYEATAQFASSV
ncbi:MAG TPA: hypothetical protein VFE47_05720 [Tepidisphaeraceae bacterium]|jgi:hypothetical protein|nr:hypothetical protein [Tepidisphaeraceae bacterium]